jgi:iron-sulfur cluster repair protein YtfE (RIC family)
MASDWPDIHSSVPDWLIEFPHLWRLIEQLHLDYSCGGKSLGAAAEEAGLDPQAVLAQLRELANGAQAPNSRTSKVPRLDK